MATEPAYSVPSSGVVKAFCDGKSTGDVATTEGVRRRMLNRFVPLSQPVGAPVTAAAYGNYGAPAEAVPSSAVGAAMGSSIPAPLDISSASPVATDTGSVTFAKLRLVDEVPWADTVRGAPGHTTEAPEQWIRDSMTHDVVDAATGLGTPFNPTEAHVHSVTMDVHNPSPFMIGVRLQQERIGTMSWNSKSKSGVHRPYHLVVPPMTTVRGEVIHENVNAGNMVSIANVHNPDSFEVAHGDIKHIMVESPLLDHMYANGDLEEATWQQIQEDRAGPKKGRFADYVDDAAYDVYRKLHKENFGAVQDHTINLLEKGGIHVERHDGQCFPPAMAGERQIPISVIRHYVVGSASPVAPIGGPSSAAAAGSA